MKQVIYYDQRAEKEFSKIPENIQKYFEFTFDVLRKTGTLSFPLGRKLQKNLFEVRTTGPTQWRATYAYLPKNKIIILSFFAKKTQQTPLKEIKLAVKRRKNYL